MKSSAERTPTEVTHNVGLKRFELRCGRDQLAFLSYVQEEGCVVFDHTFVPEALRGGGVGNTLVRAALEEAARRRWAVIARCSFVAAFLARHPELNAGVKRSAD
ncbi:MAG: N-acetyltransferase [Verrucomicrobia bacterium]|nr:N-acetyltransferase [Verrucomicrobiota bacterium]